MLAHKELQQKHKSIKIDGVEYPIKFEVVKQNGDDLLRVVLTGSANRNRYSQGEIANLEPIKKCFHSSPTLSKWVSAPFPEASEKTVGPQGAIAGKETRYGSEVAKLRFSDIIRIQIALCFGRQGTDGIWGDLTQARLESWRARAAKISGLAQKAGNLTDTEAEKLSTMEFKDISSQCATSWW